MGNVQSGKTANFAGVIAKAVDGGYRMVIVLSGLNNNLRAQTQSRLDRDLFHDSGWTPYTDVYDDYVETKTDRFCRDLQQGRTICAVVKKNSAVLQKLLAALEAASASNLLRNVPVLIVDDEADQATPNSSGVREEVTRINSLLRSIWATVSAGTYVAYTATPFANVLIDPDVEGDLFPSDFLVALTPGEGYFGPERVFGLADVVEEKDGLVRDGLDMVRKIPEADADALRAPSGKEARESFDPPLPPSLEDALCWFLIATAIRRVRGDARAHSSMLIHTTHYIGPHLAMRGRVDAFLNRLRAMSPEALDRLLRKLWDQEKDRVASERTQPLPGWREVIARIPSVLDKARCVVDNSESEDRLVYEDEKPETVIAIGGGTLSRGLTLMGLVVSYFTRTSSTYDTLLQMGRWFGYRVGYEDLPRIWVSRNLDREYAFLARVEADLRQEILSVSGGELTPAQVGVKVRVHPGRLEITNGNRMGSAKVAQLGLSGLLRQTIVLAAPDRETIEKNWSTAELLLANRVLERAPNVAGSSKWLARDVEGAAIQRFLDHFEHHPDAAQFTRPDERELVRRWIAKNAAGSVWNVALMGLEQADAALGSKVLAGRTVHAYNRAPKRNGTAAATRERLDFQAIVSQPDRLVDVDRSVRVTPAMTTEADYRRARRKHAGGRGLLMLYPISRGSRPKDSGSMTRSPMPHLEDHILGFALVFPYVEETSDEGTFVSVRDLPENPTTEEDQADD